MINLVFCILGLTLGLWATIYDVKQIRKFSYSPWYILVLKFIGWFACGFFGSKTVKWIIGINTLLF